MFWGRKSVLIMRKDCRQSWKTGHLFHFLSQFPFNFPIVLVSIDWSVRLKLDVLTILLIKQSCRVKEVQGSGKKQNKTKFRHLQLVGVSTISVHVSKQTTLKNQEINGKGINKQQRLRFLNISIVQIFWRFNSLLMKIHWSYWSP